MRIVVLMAVLFCTGKAWASGEINVLTDLLSPFPPGCVALSLPTEPASADNELFDEVIRAPGIGSFSRDADVRVRIWRVGCADEGFSVVMVRLQKLGGPRPVLVPQAFVDAGQVEVPFHEAQLISFPAVGNIGAAGNVIPESGQTFMLAADPLAIDGLTDFLPEDYNDVFTLELFWGGFSPEAAPAGELFPIAAFEPALDPPQFDPALLHGRMSGAYTFAGNPSAGLFLNVGEQLSDIDGELVDTNFIFVAFFSYRNGEPFWTVGGTGPRPPGIGPVTMNMVAHRGGQFISSPPRYTQADLSEEQIGTLSLEVIDCNTLRVDYDFDLSGLGRSSLQAERLVRIAGYDCNPWQ